MLSLNEKLRDIYNTYKDSLNPPVPIEVIKEYLELEGVFLKDENTKKEPIDGK